MGVDLWYLAGPQAEPRRSREMLRRVLSQHAAVHPASWDIGAGPHGRPEIRGPVCDLRFSIAHTAGMMLVGVQRGGELGVDVEPVARPRIPVDMAVRWFAPAEVAALRALPAVDQPLRFLELWTLKEAYAKARGAGLIALPLDRFAIDVGPPPQLTAPPEVDPDPGRWQLTAIRLGEHLVAVATTAALELTFHDASQVLTAPDGGRRRRPSG